MLVKIKYNVRESATAVAREKAEEGEEVQVEEDGVAAVLHQVEGIKNCAHCNIHRIWFCYQVFCFTPLQFFVVNECSGLLLWFAQFEAFSPHFSFNVQRVQRVQRV